MRWIESYRQLEDAKAAFPLLSITWEHKSSEAWKSYRSKATKRGLDFTLNRVQVTDFVTDNCFYCGAAPDPFNGMDRVDNDKGYVDGNVVTSCRMCNVAKNSHSRDEFESWAVRVASKVNS